MNVEVKEGKLGGYNRDRAASLTSTVTHYLFCEFEQLPVISFMAVCQFFLRGQCRFGDSCRNEHPRDGQRQGGFGNSSWTAPDAQNTGKQQPALAFSVDSMSKDFSSQADKPLWPLSSFGPAKYEPNLISDLDESFEELRLRAVTALKNNATNDYYKYEADKISASDQIYRNAQSNVVQAYEKAAQQAATVIPASAGTAFRGFASAAPTSTSAFGSGTTGNTGSAFGGANTTSSAFGKPSAFGAFGGGTSAPSPFGGGSSASAFGSTSAPSAFGKPALGQPAFGQSAFGGQTTNPNQPTATSAFGQTAQPTSAFSQPQQSATSAFGQTSGPQSSFIKPATGAFGSTATGTSGSAFGAFGGGGTSSQSAFGGGSTGTSGTGGGFSAFAGQPSAFGLGATAPASNGAPAAPSSVFGQSAFGNPPAPSTSAFAAPASAQSSTTPFGGASAFGAPSQSQNTSASTFGGSAFSPTSNNASSGSVFGPGGSASKSPFSSNGGPSSYAFTPQPQGQSASAFAPAQPSPGPAPRSAFSSQPSAPPPKPLPGPPDFANAKSTYKPGIDKYDALLPDNYLQLLPSTVRTAFESSKFEWGKVPEWVPPKELR